MIETVAIPAGGRRSLRTYRLYGFRFRSHWPFPCQDLEESGPTDVECFEGPPSLFSDASKKAGSGPDAATWFHYDRLADGSDYLRWTGLFEFLVSAEGRQIACRALNGASQETFQTYLLGQVLSFALVKQGIEPLHATVVEVNGQAAAFLGDCGYGKSSLGAAFLQAGHSLLTDDLLVVKEDGGLFAAQPGPPRIKLFPEIANALLGHLAAGTPMNPETPKLVIPLPHPLSSRAEAPLRAIYVLRPPRSRTRAQRVTIRTLPHRRACLALIANTFNPVIVERARLARQFKWTSRLTANIPVKSLSYPHDLAFLPEVVTAIKSDSNL